MICKHYDGFAGGGRWVTAVTGSVVSTPGPSKDNGLPAEERSRYNLSMLT